MSFDSAAGEVFVRKALTSDIDAIYAIELASFSDPWSKYFFNHSMAQDTEIVFAAVSSDRIVGYGCLSVLPPEGEILNIAVSPEERGRGVGQLLLTAMLNHAAGEGVDTVFLEVRESNTAARSLYEKNGFSPIGIRKNYYIKPTEDAVVMRKSPLLADAGCIFEERS
ncbi:MAG: ribosomal-protein-alanine N-acetyltransferase [Ruminococcaceae bacterium]|nr:ribosomal-protein-alanine N-acetyltransferase [Oscillospiraceae bacterium]